MSKDLKLNLLLKATDGLSAVVKTACEQSDKAFDATNKKLENMASKFDNAGKKALIFGGALVGASALNVKNAADFQKGMNNVSTLIDTNTESLDKMSDEVLKIGKNSPKALSDLAEGLYSIRSAGIDASNQFNVLKGSEMLAVAGLATTAEAVDVATSAINAFNLKGEKANKVYDMIFKVVKYGKTNVSEFAQGFGQVAGVVASADIELDEYSASIAAMTTSGLKACVAHTQVKAAIAGLSRGSKEQMVIFKKLGAKSFGDLVKKSGGMVNAFNRIYKAVGGNQSKLIQLVGSVEGYNAILSLTGANNKTYLQTLNDMRNGGDSLSEAYIKQTEGLSNQMAIMTNGIQALSIRFGNGLIPAVKAGVGAINQITALFDRMPEGLVNFVSMATAGIGVAALFGGTTCVAIGSIIRNFILLRKVMRGASILSWANPALLPIVGVVAGITALGAAGVYCYKKFEGFRNICDGIWASLKAGGAWLAVLGNSFLNSASALWNFISPAVKFGLTVFSWINPIGLVYHAIKGLVDVLGKLVQKAGGFKTIGSKIKNWADEANKKANEVNEEVKNQRTTKQVDGSHYSGLNYVPFDGYIGELHKGEAVLTKPEANRWRSGEFETNNSTSSMINITYAPNITTNSSAPMTKEAKDEFLKLLNSHKDEIVRLVKNVLAREEARAYAR